MIKSQQAGLARELRFNQTEAERKLWAKLRNKQMAGVKFRRQQYIGNYIVDFVSFDDKLIIEIDGGQHNESPTMKKDAQRTMWLEREGFHVLRFWNNEVLLNTEGVLLKIQEVLKMKSHPHLTSPLKGEGRAENKQPKVAGSRQALP